MGKRSPNHFERRKDDLYETPSDAVSPLIPYVVGIVTKYVEPLPPREEADPAFETLRAALQLCCYICFGQDALALGHCDDPVITNTSHDRKIMHPIIAHLQRVAPTWLLIDMDWASTRQAAPYLPYCSDIVAIGRVKWIEGSKYTGKDNYAWYRFAARHEGGPVFHGRGVTPAPARIRTESSAGPPMSGGAR